MIFLQRALFAPSKSTLLSLLLIQSPKKINLVAKLVRGMRVEDALLQLQVTVKRAAKTVYQVRLIYEIFRCIIFCRPPFPCYIPT